MPVPQGDVVKSSQYVKAIFREKLFAVFLHQILCPGMHAVTKIFLFPSIGQDPLNFLELDIQIVDMRQSVNYDFPKFIPFILLVKNGVYSVHRPECF